MRIHIELDDELVAQVDELAGPQGRIAFVRMAIQHAVQMDLRWVDIDAAAGSIEASGHEWDADPAHWVREQRRSPTTPHW